MKVLNQQPESYMLIKVRIFKQYILKQTSDIQAF